MLRRQSRICWMSSQLMERLWRSNWTTLKEVSRTVKTWSLEESMWQITSRLSWDWSNRSTDAMLVIVPSILLKLLASKLTWVFTEFKPKDELNSLFYDSLEDGLTLVLLCFLLSSKIRSAAIPRRSQKPEGNCQSGKHVSTRPNLFSSNNPWQKPSRPKNFHLSRIKWKTKRSSWLLPVRRLKRWVSRFPLLGSDLVPIESWVLMSRFPSAPPQSSCYQSERS